MTGEWKLSDAGPALVVSSGLIFLKKRKPKGLYLEDILAMIHDQPKRQYYSRAMNKRITLGEAIANDELDKLGDIRVTYSSIDLILLSPERVFEKLPKTGKQLITKHYRSKARSLA